MEEACKQIAELQTAFEQQQRAIARMERRLRMTWTCAFVGIVGAFVLGLSPEAQAQFGVTLTTLNTRLTAVESKTQFVSVSGGEMFVTGTNLNIRSGSGSTDGAINGKGNLIVGYNEALGTFGDEHGGSHNLIVGYRHDYLSYGGVVVGQFNKITSPFSSVSGGHFNIASGFAASVSGGQANTASGNTAAISGGANNSAPRDYSSVSGGQANISTGFAASVSGGQFNIASGDFTSVSGGSSNEARALASSMSGGFGRGIIPFFGGPDFSYTWRAGNLSAGP